MREKPTWHSLTIPQQRTLTDVVEAGTKSYNGRALGICRRLRDRGLITFNLGMVASGTGKHAFLIEASATDEGIELVQEQQ